MSMGCRLSRRPKNWHRNSSTTWCRRTTDAANSKRSQFKYRTTQHCSKFHGTTTTFIQLCSMPFRIHLPNGISSIHSKITPLIAALAPWSQIGWTTTQLDSPTFAGIRNLTGIIINHPLPRLGDANSCITKKYTGVTDRAEAEINVTGGNSAIVVVRFMKEMTWN